MSFKKTKKFLFSSDQVAATRLQVVVIFDINVRSRSSFLQSKAQSQQFEHVN